LESALKSDDGDNVGEEDKGQVRN